MNRILRKTRSIKSRTTVLILCCGESEVAYFKDFREYFAGRRRCVSITVKRCCGDPDGVGDSVDSHTSGMVYDKIFCVLDKDNFSDEKIVELSKKENDAVRIILQIPAFELWGCIHYSYSTAQNSVDELVNNLRKHITNYKKGQSIFSATVGQLSTAIENSKRLNEYHRTTSGTQNNPSTKIPEIYAYMNSMIME